MISTNVISIKAMEDVLPDVEPVVRQALMEQVPLVTRYFIDAGQDAGYTVVLHILLPMVAELTTDRNAQVIFTTSSFYIFILLSFFFFLIIYFVCWSMICWVLVLILLQVRAAAVDSLEILANIQFINKCVLFISIPLYVFFNIFFRSPISILLSLL